MRILIAPSGYKECLEADRVANAIARGVEATGHGHELRTLPLVDGGEGGCAVSATIRALSSFDHCRRRLGPVRTSIRRRPPPFASSLTLSITSLEAPSLQAQPAHPSPAPEDGPLRRAYVPGIDVFSI
ncbi:glycerate kinase [Leptolyngbya sp. 15MV]|nr:glycerate kinase [Leptolyngbya sp. 15MV]